MDIYILDTLITTFHCNAKVLPNGCSSEGGTSHEKHIKMAVLDNQAKIQQFSQNIERLTGKSHLKFF